MNGILLVDKPAGWTSHDVVQKMRRLYETKQVGHTGTLDPMATGLLPICIGKATKVAEYISDDRKAYVARAVRGIRTDTGDTTGVVYARSDVPIPDNLDDVLRTFTGEQLQLPPMHSALKYKGKKLYDYARMGICVPREKRPITVTKLACLERGDTEISLLAEVSSGTYIRTLLDDIGVAAGCFFTMSDLRRVSVGNTTVDGSYTIEALEAMPFDARKSLLLPMDRLLDHLPPIHLPAKRLKPMTNGMSTRISFVVEKAPIYRIYAGDVFVGLGIVKEEDGTTNVCMKKVLV
ncbi:tRNA pseudouridine(55) synthase TruB [Aedoeadaptatus acetigenes]|uniref:tRNA pseudouridine synthase B n=1 Tax=Aedoeadaptatus acetigenes TaxID=2981723 RepID=A0ABV1J6X0_9FIRM|nr:tRNA pseudouridine(55) synthase TruB [Peptoniphilaceae bacterium]